MQLCNARERASAEADGRPDGRPIRLQRRAPEVMHVSTNKRVTSREHATSHPSEDNAARTGRAEVAWEGPPLARRDDFRTRFLGRDKRNPKSDARASCYGPKATQTLRGLRRQNQPRPESLSPTLPSSGASASPKVSQHIYPLPGKPSKSVLATAGQRQTSRARKALKRGEHHRGKDAARSEAFDSKRNCGFVEQKTSPSE